MVQQLGRTAVDSELVYPESDGKPLADNTIQFDLIVKIHGGIDALFKNDPNVFVAGDLLWYPVEGSLTSQAPDVMVAFGRPKGDRGSYKQWQEGNIAPQVVFEILSPSNTRKEMARKFEFYQEHGVEEYYLYDPDKNMLEGWVRGGNQFTPVHQMEGWVSPRLGTRFETHTGMLELYRPDGDRFETVAATREWGEQKAQRAEQEAQRADREAQRADQEAQARYDAIPQLLGLGLSVEQVAEALGFSVEEVMERR